MRGRDLRDGGMRGMSPVWGDTGRDPQWQLYGHRENMMRGNGARIGKGRRGEGGMIGIECGEGMDVIESLSTLCWEDVIMSSHLAYW